MPRSPPPPKNDEYASPRDPVAPPGLLDDRNGPEWEEVALLEIAAVFHEPAHAVTLVVGSGFPKAMVPGFTNALTFFTKVAHEARAGALSGGFEAIIHRAGEIYPGNPVFGRGHGAMLRPRRSSPGRRPKLHSWWGACALMAALAVAVVLSILGEHRPGVSPGESRPATASGTADANGAADSGADPTGVHPSFDATEVVTSSQEIYGQNTAADTGPASEDSALFPNREPASKTATTDIEVSIDRDREIRQRTQYWNRVKQRFKKCRHRLGRDDGKTSVVLIPKKGTPKDWKFADPKDKKFEVELTKCLDEAAVELKRSEPRFGRYFAQKRIQMKFKDE